MSITNKAISTKLLNIIIRTNHGQTEIVVWRFAEFSNVCDHLLASCSNDSFASPTPINRWIKACGMLFHSCTSASRSCYSISGGF